MIPSLKKEIPAILDGVMQEITDPQVKIQRTERKDVLSKNVCSVQTTFEGGCQATLVLLADVALMRRMTQTAIGEENVAAQDVEDFTKEFLNVLCGKIVARMFQLAGISSRFCIPVFCAGRCVPEYTTCECVLNYTSAYNEGVQMLHLSS